MTVPQIKLHAYMAVQYRSLNKMLNCKDFTSLVGTNSHHPKCNPREGYERMGKEGSMIGSFEHSFGWSGLVRQEPPQEAQENGGCSK